MREPGLSISARIGIVWPAHPMDMIQPSEFEAFLSPIIFVPRQWTISPASNRTAGSTAAMAGTARESNRYISVVDFFKYGQRVVRYAMLGMSENLGLLFLFCEKGENLGLLDTNKTT